MQESSGVFDVMIDEILDERVTRFNDLFNEIRQHIIDGKIDLNKSFVQIPKLRLVFKLLLNEIIVYYELDSTKKLSSSGNEIKILYNYLYRRFQTKIGLIIDVLQYKLRNLINILPPYYNSLSVIKLMHGIVSLMLKHGRNKKSKYVDPTARSEIDSNPASRESAQKAAYLLDSRLDICDKEVFNKVLKIIFDPYEVNLYATKEEILTLEFINIVLHSFKQYETLNKFKQYIDDRRRRSSDNISIRLFIMFSQLITIHMDDVSYSFYRIGAF